MKELAVINLHNAIMSRREEAINRALWDCIQVWAGVPLKTASGLDFSYCLKCGKHGAPTAELVITRKNSSKTLTRSSILYALRRVCSAAEYADNGFIPPFFKGPKAIGQIFGISYMYSLFWNWGLIRVPPEVEQKLRSV